MCLLRAFFTALKLTASPSCALACAEGRQPGLGTRRQGHTEESCSGCDKRAGAGQALIAHMSAFVAVLRGHLPAWARFTAVVCSVP